MGMAASQARLIQLEARQSNLEYQGQQINQERSILSQQCTDLYNSLLAMSVPTPPSTAEFTTIEYKGVQGATSFSLGNIIPTGDTYSVEFNYKKTGHNLANTGTAAVHVGKDENDNTTYTVGTSEVISLGEASEKDMISDEVLKNYIKAIKNRFPEEFVDMDAKDPDDPDAIAPAVREKVLQNYMVYSIEEENGAGSVSTYFLKKEDIDKIHDNSNGFREVDKYKYNPTGTYTETEPIKGCKLIFDTTGRISKIEIPVKDTSGEITGHIPIALEATKTTDESAYQDAYAKYEYAMYEYDKKQQEINAKTEIIQQQDRNLELKLTRLDNERKQITTEIEAVKKVVQENIEGTYKTFSG